MARAGRTGLNRPDLKGATRGLRGPLEWQHRSGDPTQIGFPSQTLGPDCVFLLRLPDVVGLSAGRGISSIWRFVAAPFMFERRYGSDYQEWLLAGIYSP